MLCLKCGLIIASEWPFQYHTSCFPDDMPLPGKDGMTGFDIGIVDDLINVVRWAHNNSPRSQQVSLGCSEAGHPCERRIGYTMAAIPPVNLMADPWPATVGTSIHAWLEGAVNAYQEVHGLNQWATEMEVFASPLMKGHTDLYDKSRFTVLDWKFPGASNMKKMRKEGPSQQYQVQVQLYGLGHVQAGRRVDRVGIVALAREAWLKDMYVWTTPFDRGVAEAALDRVDKIGKKLIEMDIMNNPDRWIDVPSDPGFMCRFCPYYQRGVMTNDKGCAGV